MKTGIALALLFALAGMARAQVRNDLRHSEGPRVVRRQVMRPKPLQPQQKPAGPPPQTTVFYMPPPPAGRIYLYSPTLAAPLPPARNPR